MPSSNPRYRQLTRSEPLQRVDCVQAAEFRVWLATYILQDLGTYPTPSGIATLKYFLQDEWHRMRNTLPSGHPSRLNPHECVDEQYYRVYARLHQLERQAGPLAVGTLEAFARPQRGRKKTLTPDDVEQIFAQTFLGEQAT